MATPQSTTSGLNSEFTVLMTNPLGLTNVNLFAAPNVLDIDNDGDLDIFIGEENGDVSFFENIGSVTNPVFKAAVVNPFQLQNVADVVGDGAIADALEAMGKIPQYDFNPAFADLDNDGDQDVLVGMYPYGFTIYYENIGDAGNPLYGEPIINPFGLPIIAEFTSPAFADIDADGDLDLFIGDFPNGYTHYFENIGTKEAPVFAEGVINPFGLTSTGVVSSPEFEDIDADGDLDVFIGIDTGDALYFENVGDASNPVFAAPITNPFGLESVGGSSSHEFADLDGDGDLDALLGTKDGLTFYFENVADSADTVPEFIRYKTTIVNFEQDTVFHGDGLNDYVISKGGNDDIYTGNGRNQVKAGAGHDRVYGGTGDDVLYGDAGNDQLFAGQGENRLFGGDGHDSLYGGDGNDSFTGGSGDDIIYGNGGNDSFTGGSGDDILYGGNGNDIFSGGHGNDIIYGNGGNDLLAGGLGDDQLYGSGSAEIFDGGLGTNKLWLNGGNDIVVLTAGDGMNLVYGFQAGQTAFELRDGLVFSDLSFSQGQTSSGAQFTRIVAGNDELAQVNWVNLNQLNVASNFVAT